MSKTKVLFLCNGNSCRSKIAEAWTNKLLPDFEAYSAGVAPHDINPYAIKVMEEKSVHMSIDTRSVQSFAEADLDFVITVCDRASKNCPVSFEGVTLLHRNFVGPSKIARTKDCEEERLDCYRKTRDEIFEFIQELPQFLAHRTSPV